MQTEHLSVNSSSIARAAEVLRGGGLVAFPTETVYGLGANALDAAAVARIFEAKGRPANNPLIVHIGDATQVGQVVADWPNIAETLAKHFWPGPLTLVLPKRPEVPSIVTAGGATVAVRIPAHPVALALLRGAGVPVAAPSANRSSQLSPTCAEHVRRSLDGRLDVILDGGPTPGGIESTVLDLTTIPPRLLRPGLLQIAEIEAVIGAVQRHGMSVSEMALPSPGMLPRHYAPRTPLICVEENERQALDALLETEQRIGLLTFRSTTAPKGGVVYALRNDPVAAAAQLYAALHRLDDMQLDRIAVELPPDVEEWSAIRDRLRRASASG
jgi:L-threonylcarbamoyladenylate synthase